MSSLSLLSASRRDLVRAFDLVKVRRFELEAMQNVAPRTYAMYDLHLDGGLEVYADRLTRAEEMARDALHTYRAARRAILPLNG